MNVSSVVISFVPSRVSLGFRVSFSEGVRRSAATWTWVTSDSDSLFKHTYARKCIPTNILPKPFGRAARPVRPVPSREGSMIVASDNWERGDVVNGDEVIVGMSCVTRFGLRRRITLN